MKNMYEIKAVLENLSDLLRQGERENWADVFDKSAAEFEFDSAAASAKIISMYGGMGSFNDVILYKKGRLLLAENGELDALRDRLFYLCSM